MNNSLIQEQARKQVLTTTKIIAIKMRTFITMDGPFFHRHLSEQVIANITAEIEKGMDVLLESDVEDFDRNLDDFEGILQTYDDAFHTMAQFINR